MTRQQGKYNSEAESVDNSLEYSNSLGKWKRLQVYVQFAIALPRTLSRQCQSANKESATPITNQHDQTHRYGAARRSSSYRPVLISGADSCCANAIRARAGIDAPPAQKKTPCRSWCSINSIGPSRRLERINLETLHSAWSAKSSFAYASLARPAVYTPGGRAFSKRKRSSSPWT